MTVTITGRDGWTPKWQGLAQTHGKRNLYVAEAFQAVIAARQGFGIALADRIEVAHELREGTLVRLTNATVDGLHPIVMVGDSDDQLPLRARLFVDHVLKALALRLNSMPYR